MVPANSERRVKRIWVIVVTVIAIIIAGLAIIVLLVLPNHPATDTGCAPNTKKMTTNLQNDSLSSFPVACIQVTNPVNRTIILQGAIYIANTPEQQQLGFMNVTSFGNCNGLATDGVECLGMLFNFSSSQNLCFWMHDTEIPLEQDWIASNHTVTSIYQAQPENDLTVCYPGQYVLETNPSEEIPIGSTVAINS
jgi:uncharacterized membrane protein (UPF0127 family)